jgi:hypothetical protein
MQKKISFFLWFVVAVFLNKIDHGKQFFTTLEHSVTQEDWVAEKKSQRSNSKS